MLGFPDLSKAQKKKKSWLIFLIFLRHIAGKGKRLLDFPDLSKALNRKRKNLGDFPYFSMAHYRKRKKFA